MERVDRHPVGRVAVGVVAGTAVGTAAAAEGIAVGVAVGTESVEDIAGTAVVVAGHSQGVLAILSSRFGWIHRPWAQVLGQWEIAGWCCFACC